MKSVLKAVTPPILWKLGRDTLSRFRRREPEATVRVGRFDLLVPGESLLSRIGSEQPYRNLAVGVIARFVGRRDAGVAIFDVGANVGGTAAMIASFCPNPLVLVEPSDHYLAYLTRNTALFPNRCRIVKGIITDGSVNAPVMELSRGTARVVEGAPGRESTIRQLGLADLHDGAVGLVKIDADGWDFKIIEDSLPWLAERQPILYYEAEVDTLDEVSHANRVVERCREIGYRSAIVWDDAGCFMCATERMETAGDLFRYLFECRRHASRTGLFSYNVGLFHEKDREIFEQVSAYFRDGVPMQDGLVKIDD